MSGAWAIDESRLTVGLDVRHPHAYLALHPAIELGREEGLEINWLPIRVPVLRAPTTPGPADDRGLRHRRARARAIAREIETYASVQGLELRGLYRDPDPTALNLGWLFLRERARERLEDYLARVFRAYWSLELDPGSGEAVARIVAEFGLEAAAFEAWSRERGPESAADLEQELGDRGWGGTPCYWIDGELFLGRQHLPMIRWILGGRRGRGPI